MGKSLILDSNVTNASHIITNWIGTSGHIQVGNLDDNMTKGPQNLLTSETHEVTHEVHTESAPCHDMGTILAQLSFNSIS